MGKIAIITIDNVQVLQGGNPPTKVKLTCNGQKRWNYNAPNDRPNLASIMTVGARIKVDCAEVESTNHPGTIMKFINDAVPAQPNEPNTFPTKEPYKGGGGNGSASASGSTTINKADQFRTPVQIQRQEVASAVCTLLSGSGKTIEEVLQACDTVLAWADMTPDATFPANTGADNGSSFGQAPVSSLSDTPAPPSFSAPGDDDDIPW